jgi:anti-sigma regulatory factor (Ser/Thr protein kinase)
MEFIFTVNNSLPVDEILAEQVKFALFRAIQEALNNALKHSQATKVEVMFEMDRIQVLTSPVSSGSPGSVSTDLTALYLIEVRISDNGKGVDKCRLEQFNSNTSPEQEFEQLEKGEHLGIGIIKQQIGQFSEIYQSEINFYSTDGAGFEVAIALHIPAEAKVAEKAVPFTLAV